MDDVRDNSMAGIRLILEEIRDIKRGMAEDRRRADEDRRRADEERHRADERAQARHEELMRHFDKRFERLEEILEANSRTLIVVAQGVSQILKNQKEQTRLLREILRAIKGRWNGHSGNRN